jgi:hypothetical protein
LRAAHATATEAESTNTTESTSSSARRAFDFGLCGLEAASAGATFELTHARVDVARAERDHHVTRAHDGLEHVGQRRLVAHVARVVVAVLADRLHEALGRDALDRGLAGGVDVGD